MENRLGLIFDMKRVLLNNKYYNIYKLRDVEFGVVASTKRDLEVFIRFNKSDNGLIYIINENNKDILKSDFDLEGEFAGIYSNEKFYSLLLEEKADLEKIKKIIMDEWGGYRVFEAPKTIRLINNIEKYKDILDEAFKYVNPAKEKDKVSNEKLSKYGVFLTNKDYLFNPAIGRDYEIERLERILLGYDQSALIVGESGVGKTAIVEGLAYKIKKGLVHEKLKDLQIVSISSTSMISGTRYVGDKEERMLGIINELKKNKNIIMFTDEIHTMVGAGRGDKSNLDIANILKPYLDRGDIKIIGSTTNEEYDELMIDTAFKRRFKKVSVEEPNKENLFSIIDGVIKGLESYYNINFDFESEKKDFIYSNLIELTNKENREQKENVKNPDLVLSIIKEMFSSALYNNHEKIEIEDIVYAINENDRLLKYSKERFSKNITKLLSEEVKCLKKVIELPFGKKNME